MNDALYDEVRDRLVDTIAAADYFSGTVSFDFDGVACRLTASLIVSRRTERRPEGTFRVLADLIPVWWEFHTVADDGEQLNDFSFDELRRRI